MSEPISKRICLTGLLAAGLLVESRALGDEKPGKEAQPGRKAVAQESAGKAPKAGDYPVIGHVEKRGRTITIKAGPKGTVYTVKSSDGKVLFENVSLQELRARAPELHEFVTTAVAGRNRKEAEKMDASLGRLNGR